MCGVSHWRSALSTSVAVIGAGIAGLAAARSLHDAGRQVTVFDKARGVGGRMSTRRHGGLAFDHGAQYFTVRDTRFRQCIDACRAAGVVTEWTGRIVVLDADGQRPSTSQTRYVGVPGMNAVTKHLAVGLTTMLPTRIVRISHRDAQWRLHSDDGREHGPYDALVVALPAPQAAHLLDGISPLSTQAARVSFAPCWAVMLGFSRTVPTTFDAAFVHDSALAWIARNNAKPARPDAESWVLHATPTWSADHLESTSTDVADALLAAFVKLTGTPPDQVVHVDAHRWRYAQPINDGDTPALLDASRRLAVCGDWCHAARVEGAFLSGLTAAQQLNARP